MSTKDPSHLTTAKEWQKAPTEPICRDSTRKDAMQIICDEETRAELERDSKPSPSLDPKYAEWVDAYVLRTPNLLGRCKEAVAEMAAAFPELTRVPGHVYVARWGQRAHWWLTTPDGTILDPTASQFPFIFDYEPWRPGTEVRVGRCMECGQDLYAAAESLDVEPPHRSMCDDQCAAAFESSRG